MNQSQFKDVAIASLGRALVEDPTRAAKYNGAMTDYSIWFPSSATVTKNFQTLLALLKNAPLAYAYANNAYAKHIAEDATSPMGILAAYAEKAKEAVSSAASTVTSTVASTVSTSVPSFALISAAGAPSDVSLYTPDPSGGDPGLPPRLPEDPGLPSWLLPVGVVGAATVVLLLALKPAPRRSYGDY